MIVNIILAVKKSVKYNTLFPVSSPTCAGTKGGKRKIVLDGLTVGKSKIIKRRRLYGAPATLFFPRVVKGKALKVLGYIGVSPMSSDGGFGKRSAQ